MRVAVFSSHGPGNLQAALDAAGLAPDLIEVCLVVTDSTGIPSVRLAERLGLSVISREFGKATAHLKGTEVSAASDHLHDEILAEIQRFEERTRPIDLCVLAYRRIIRGALYDYFCDRMINQHPADLTVFDGRGSKRRYTGIGGLSRSLADGVSSTRTSTILVTRNVDGGEILVQGPPLAVSRRGGDFDVDAHEEEQKRVSDWPALKLALHLIAHGRLTVGPPFWSDGCRSVYLDGRRLAYGGLQLESEQCEPNDWPPPTDSAARRTSGQ
jgi:folate-dependent phosphoribosylglycinamide formyltransferase PurN